MFKIQLPLPLKYVYLRKDNSSEKIGSNEAEIRKSQSSENKNIEREMEKIKQYFYNKGYEDGKREGERSVLTLKTSLKKAVDMLERGKRDFFREKEKELIAIATAMAQRIIRKEISLDTKIVEKIVREAIQRATDSDCEQVVVRMNPQDWEKLKTIDKKLDFSIRGGKQKKNIRFEKDEDILPGGCMVETEKGVINATIESQLERLGKALLGEEK